MNKKEIWLMTYITIVLLLWAITTFLSGEETLNFENRAAEFMKKGERFTADEGEILSERVKKLEEGDCYNAN